ncbi:MAG: aspartate aminotransferase family protein [Oscillospiraceae bacterium]|nr:aspartate aminotransferase family protein [Oscillospiraceae bacterium]
MANNQDLIKYHDEYIMGTYGRYPVVLVEGKGSVLKDADGKSYIDFTSGIGVNSLGAANNGWVSAVSKQLDRIQHISNYYYSDVSAKLAEKLTKLAKMSRVFFSNSGAEANEGAIKLARKYSFDKYGKGRGAIITLKDSFHGRTMTTLAATGQDVFHNYFFPFPEGFRFVEKNNIEEFISETSNNSDICAVIIEPIQGESGVNFIDKDYIKQVKNICLDKDILLIFDEVQTGIARTGKVFAHEYFDVEPDIITAAKGLGGGLPIGAFMCGEKLKNTLSAGMHGSTYGGNPAACAGALEVLETVSKIDFLDEVIKKGEYIVCKIKGFTGIGDKIIEIRQKGLMVGLQIKLNGGEAPKDYALKCLNNGLLVLTAGSDVIRFLPPLNITYEEIDKGLGILEKILCK